MKKPIGRRRSLFGLAIFVSLATSAKADLSDCMNPIEADLGDDVAMKFCEIPAADMISIGSEDGESDERPVKERNFERFFIGQFEVTQEQYRAVTGSEPWRRHDGTVRDMVRANPENPAVYVSWFDAVNYAAILNGCPQIDTITGSVFRITYERQRRCTQAKIAAGQAIYRLPTEAEWEYAARGTENRYANYYWGDDFIDSFAWYYGNIRPSMLLCGRSVHSCPHHLTSNCANDFGLMHILGNISEWVADAYVSSYRDAPLNGNVAVIGDPGSSYRVARGGDWTTDAQALRSANRSWGEPNRRYVDTGFRLVKTSW